MQKVEITHRQKLNWKEVSKECEIHSLLSTSEKVAIVNILSTEEFKDNLLTFNQLYKKIIQKYGEVVSERQVRYIIKSFEEEKLITSIITKSGTKIKLNADYKKSKNMPKIQINVFALTILMGALIVFYDAFISPVPFLSHSAIILVIYTSLLLIANYIDFNYSVTDYKNLLLEFINKIKKETPIFPLLLEKSLKFFHDKFKF